MPARALFLAAALALAQGAAAQKAAFFSDANGAIRGYDPVAYFTAGAPVKGSGAHTFEWRGATWRFSSAENRARFAAAPEKYAPRYGGYCAYGVAQGYAVAVDPHAWKIVEGRLYLNYSRSVQASWQQDVPGYLRKAEANWPGVLTR